MSDSIKFNAGGKKRKYRDHNRKSRNPRRGFPGVMLTCETGRERKCQHEGMDILNHYCDPDTIHQEKSNYVISLEEELKLLRSKSKSANHMFSVYDTGIRGIVFVMCTKPGCNLIPFTIMENKKEDSDSRKKGNNEFEKKPRVDSNNKSSAKPEAQPENNIDKDNAWDPVETVRTVIQELKENSNTAPSSRFVTRMIPMQATCFSSKDEIRGTAKVLLEKMFQPLAAKSFAISAKRRQCGHINRSEIIDTIAELVLELKPQCIVDLTSPDVTIVVEVCRALCGISVVPKIENFHNNFSLIAAREDNGSTTSDKN